MKRINITPSSTINIISLYLKFKFYKTLLFSLITYPLTFLFLHTEIKNKKDKILKKEIKKYIKTNYGLNFAEIKGTFALGGLIEIYVKKLYNFFKISSGNVVYDIGATIGEYSLKCAKEGAEVFSFELEKEPYDAMKENIKTNGFRKQIIPFHCRVDDKKQSIDFFFKKVKRAPTLIKIDIEGDEEKALIGGEKVIEKYKPRIILETHSLYLEKRCLGLLKEKGYKIAHHINMDNKTELFFLIHENDSS